MGDMSIARLKALLSGPHPRQQYRDRGYFVFRDVLPRRHVDQLTDLVENLIVPHQGPLLRQDGHRAAHAFFPGTRLVSNPLLNAHLPISEPMRPLERALTELIASPELARCLRELDEAQHYNIHQTLLFFASQTTQPHLDSWGLDTSPRGFAHTLWIPLQDMTYLSGLPSVIPWRLGKVVTEADLGLPAEGTPSERYNRYQQALASKLFAGRPESVTALVRRGDLCVWSSLTPHFTLPSSPAPTPRLSLQVLLRPSHLRWGNFVDQPQHHPTNRHIRMSERFSYFISEDISREHQIAGGLDAPAT